MARRPARLVARRGVLLPLSLLIGVQLAAGVFAAATVRPAPPSNVLSRAFATTAGARSASVMMRVTGAGAEGDTVIQGIIGFSPVRGTLHVGAGADGVTLVLASGALYTHIDALPADAHGGRQWFRTPARHSQPGVFSAVTTAAAAHLSGDRRAIHRFGEETVDGIVATHYRAIAGYTAGAALVLDAWVDAGGRVVRLQESSPGSGGTPFNLTIDYRNFGVAVPDDAPSPDDVVDTDRPPAPGFTDAA